ncbi:MAG: GGDEF domain-containing protein [bacterium]|nr:GGDEF domain-containing protein [bacterium]
MVASLKILEYEIYFPIFLNGLLMGIICYGKKKDNTIYHKQDIHYLEEITKKTQFGITNVKTMENISHDHTNKYRNDLKTSIQQLNRAKTTQEFCKYVDDLLYEDIGASGVAIYLYNEKIYIYEYQDIQKINNKKERRHNSIKHSYHSIVGKIHKTIRENSLVISYLEDRQDILRVDSIDKGAKNIGGKELSATAKFLKEINGKLVGSLFQTNFLGFIVVGKKQNKTNYTDDDIKKISLLLEIAPLIINTITLRDKALKDGLMGLYNKGYLHKRLQEEIVYASKDANPLSFIILDIDHFRIFNTKVGHLQADQVLKAMGEYLSQAIRPTDEAFRYGGEEICVILPNTTLKEAKHIAERLNKGVQNEQIFLDLEKKHKLGITISLGVATLHDTKIIDDLNNREIKVLKDKLIEASDDALYIAKDSGRNQVQIIETMNREELTARQKKNI